MKTEIDRILLIGCECFGASDEYSELSTLSEFLAYQGGKYLVHKVNGVIAGYLLYLEHKDHIEGIRIGVSAPYRRRGISTKLIRKIIRLSHEKGKPFRTYTSSNNLESLNAHIKAGMFITKIDEFVLISSNEKKK